VFVRGLNLLRGVEEDRVNLVRFVYDIPIIQRVYHRGLSICCDSRFSDADQNQNVIHISAKRDLRFPLWLTFFKT
jgi:hypothetical protein